MRRNPSIWKGIFLALMAVGLYSAGVRFLKGLGEATNLSDAFPWGLWIGFDVLVGVGIAAGGFVIAATVHIFHIEKYESIARPTILTAFLGYLLVIFALFFDLGQPWRIWHPIIMWNPHSVMFEVGWCVTLYTTVLMLEFSPLVFERFGLHLPLRVVRAIYVPLVIAGVLLSLLHQSSLGTLYVIVPDKLYGLWYTPLLPIFFFLSAVAAGLAMTIFESFLSYRAFGKRIEAPLLRNLGRVIVVVLGVYAVWKVEDLAARGNFHLIFQTRPEAVLFWGEMGLGVLLPMLLFAMPRVRASDGGLFFAAVLTVMGFVVGRLNVAVTGMAASSGTAYFPSWMELSVTASLVAAGFMAFGLAVKHLPIFPEAETHAPRPRPQPVLQPRLLGALWLLLVVGVVAVGYSMWTEPVAASPEPLAEPIRTVSAELTLPAAIALADGADSPGPVHFDHETHVDRSAPDCQGCHATRFRILGGGLVSPAVDRGEPPYHAVCGSCHDGANSFAIDDGCEICHVP